MSASYPQIDGSAWETLTRSRTRILSHARLLPSLAGTREARRECFQRCQRERPGRALQYASPRRRREGGSEQRGAGVQRIHVDDHQGRVLLDLCLDSGRHGCRADRRYRSTASTRRSHPCASRTALVLGQWKLELERNALRLDQGPLGRAAPEPGLRAALLASRGGPVGVPSGPLAADHCAGELWGPRRCRAASTEGRGGGACTGSELLLGERPLAMGKRHPRLGAWTLGIKSPVGDLGAGAVDPARRRVGLF